MNTPLPTAVFWLVIYQWILVLLAVALGCWIAFPVWEDWSALAVSDLFGASAVLPLTCWATAMGFASVGMGMRSQRGLLVAMICHLLLAILGLLLMLTFGFLSFRLTRGSQPKEMQGFAPLYFLFLLMWLPFVLISRWAFFYLRDMRKRLMTTGSLDV